MVSATASRGWAFESRAPEGPHHGSVPGERHAFVSAHVTHAVHVGEILRGQQFVHTPSLIPTVFEQQPAAAHEMRWRGRDDCTDRVEAVATGHERGRRLVT